MKLTLLGLFVAAAVQLQLVSGETNGPAPTVSGDAYKQLVAKIPVCAIKCLAPNIRKFSCELGDVACLCRNHKGIESHAIDCIRSSCSLTETLETKRLTESACEHPIRNKAGRYTAMNVTTGVITIILAVARIAYKKFLSRARTAGPDDILILIAVLLGIPGIVVNQIGLIGHGLGTDIWMHSLSELRKFALYFYVMEIIYLIEIMLIKLSLSLFYLSIFPGVTIRRLLIGTAAVNILAGGVFIMVGVFQCTPLNFYWTQYDDPPAVGYCINLNLFAWVNAGWSLLMDLWMIILPLSRIKKLDLHWKKKFGVVIMFLIGTFVTIISLLRLQSVIYFANSYNQTWDEWNPAWWSTMEVNIGVICTCLPTVRLILVHIFPSLNSSEAAQASAGFGNLKRHSSVGDSEHYDLESCNKGTCSMELTCTALTVVEDTKPYDIGSWRRI